MCAYRCICKIVCVCVSRGRAGSFAENTASTRREFSSPKDIFGKGGVGERDGRGESGHFLKINLYWSIVDFQGCVLLYSRVYISYTYIQSFLDSSHI